MKLTVGQDFGEVYQLIFRVKRNYPQYVQNIRRVIHNVDRYIGEYNSHLILYQRHGKQCHYDDAQKALDHLASLLTILERAELMGYLSGESLRRDFDTL